MRQIISPIGRNNRGPEVVNLQEGLLLLLRRQLIRVPDNDRQFLEEGLKREQEEQIYSDFTAKIVGIFQEQHSLQVTEDVDAKTAETLNRILRDLGIFQPEDQSTTFTVEGKIASRSRAGVGGLRVEIVDKNVGGDVRLAEAVTDDAGGYTATFKLADLQQRGKQQPDLQARVFARETSLGVSEVRYNASNRETLNVLLMEKADSSLPSEHETLTGALFANFRGNLRDLKETDDQQDITYLANKTGWDARAVALAALADQFSARTMDASGAPRIEPALFYALFRAGLPANEDALYNTDMQTVEAVWKKAAEQGVIPETRIAEIPKLIQQFQTLSAQKMLTSPALVGASSLKEMLTASRLDDTQQQQFAELYATHRTDVPAFWDAVTNVFGTDTANRLQVDGKLGFLTINNAPLILELHSVAGENGLSDPLQLAQLGYHRAEKWNALLTSNISIPEEIPGDTPEAKRTNYVEYLAAQVRLSYPTASVAEMIKSGDLQVGIPDQVHTFLTENQGKFEIGMQPVQQYIVRNNLQVADETVTQVKRLQRVYQITPNDQAMTGLIKNRIDAAYHVVRYEKEAFVQTFAADLGGADSAAQTYDKSVQVHNTVLNVAISYLSAKNGIGLGAQPLKAAAQGSDTAGHILQPAPHPPPAENAGDVIAYPTLEGLFGSMDFCACDHCRSIMSPAAYLVDLLLFIDQPVPPVGTENPQTVLLERRPDVQHLPLTCENTNTALPYIDVVNETLEYFIANNIQKLSLNGYVGHDTDRVASEDLLASPQFVMDSAYTTLRGERFPTPLPFHQPLENLRRYFDKFEVPLPLAMERFRNSNDLERGANPYGWRDILMEEIGLSRAEYEILTDSNAVTLWQMYGFPEETTDTDVIAALSNAKQFTRRIGITYDDLVAILKTRFINPNSLLIPKLERLNVSFATLDAIHRTPQGITDDDFNKLLPTGANEIDVTEFGGNVADWQNNNRNYAPIIRTWLNNNNNDIYTRIMGLITLAIPASTWTASKVYAVGDCVLPKEPPTGSTLYYECTTPGTSAGSEPKPWPTTPGNTYTDGTVVWICRDASSCHSFDNLAFRYSDPAKLTENISAVEFIRLLRFIRLWKKLGWTIGQTDAAICALYRADLISLDASDINDVTKLNTGFLTLLPRLGIVIRVMKALNLTPKRDLLPLLACWSPLGTHGDSALYRQMFLNPALLKQDAAFADNGYGEFLQKFDVSYSHPNTTLEQPILDAAQGRIGYDNINMRLSYNGVLDAVTRDALKAVAGVSDAFQKAVDALYAAQRLVAHSEALRSAFNLTADEFDRIIAAIPFDANAVLSIDNISTVYRRGWLARKLKLSVRELLLLTSFTGLDPFKTPDPTNPAVLQIISLVRALKDRSLKSAAALYLIWNQDLSGKSAPDPAQVTEFARTLRNDFASIEDQFAATEDPGGDIARARMTLVYGQEAADAFFALLDDTLILDVAYTNPTSTLDAAITAADSKITYDDFRHRLSYTGVLTVEHRDILKAVLGVTGEFQDAVDALFARSEDIKGSFFARYPELKPLYDAYVADTTDSPAKKRSALLAAFRPELSQRRKRQQALQRFSAAANTDLTFTQALLDPPTAPYSLHAAGHLDQPALNDVLALETPGLAAQFFFHDTATGAIDLSVPAAANLDYASGSNNPLPANPTPGMAISGIWSGQIETPEAGFYNFIVEADTMSTVILSLDGQARPLTQNGNIWRNNDPLELKAGILYDIVLTVNKVKDALSVKWETPKRAREVITARYLYPPTILAPFSDIYIRFLKAASLAKGLDLTANEIARFATDSDYQIAGDGWLNALPVRGDPAALTAVALLKPLQDLLDYARIKAAISPGDESLLTVLKDPVAATANADSLLFTLTRWDRTSLNDVLAYFGSTLTSLMHFDQFRRIYDSFALIKIMGILAKALIQATTNEPTGDTVRDLQAALRARYDANDWRTVIQPINDAMRGLQRDALVAYILHQMRSNPATEHIDTADKLFEYFLMDVQMDPCMQTSRIRHALSSVQLFIERCLMNLEQHVSPASINASQWEWMKRYRIWEANRKVFLFPENWLEPELRDDKSPFFKEIESELLQSDITEDSATTALLNYLAKLEEVAKLEPCGIYHIEADLGKRTGDIDHVIARTAGAHRKYYYRRYEYGYWTPWEQIKLDIEDNPVIPVVWNGRLLLLWLKILKQAPLAKQSPFKKDVALTSLDTMDIKTDPPKVTVQGVLCWSEYYNSKWQSAKTSDVQGPVTMGTFDPNAFDRSKVTLSVREQDGTLWVDVWKRATFHLYNTHSLPVPAPYNPPIPYGKSRVLDTLSDPFTIHYYNITPTNRTPLKRPVLTAPIGPLTIQPHHPHITDIWDAPFFFEDSRNVFFVKTTEQPVRIRDFPWYGVAVNSGIKQAVKIPPITLKIDPRLEAGPKFWGNGGQPVDPDPSIVDPIPMQQFVTEDAYIHHGIGTSGGVKYGDRTIGPSGAISNATKGV